MKEDMFDMSEKLKKNKKNPKKTKIKKAYICTYFVYICEFNVLQFSRLAQLLLLILTLIQQKVVCRLSGEYTYEKKRKTLICMLLRIAEDTLFCFQFSKKKIGLWST